MAKKCVFCGQPPKDKNKEHVIPQWLIRMTGREQKPAAESQNNNIPFMRFTLPACSACNTRYSGWEARVKGVVEKVLADAPIDATEIDLLLDWFDKVRIGLWHASYNLNPKLYDFEPKIYIDNRIGKTDRMLIVERLDTTGRGILMNGIETPIFTYSPSVFQMVINNYSFTNVSAVNLVSQKLGFPTVKDLTFVENGRLFCGLNKGTNKAVLPILRAVNPLPNQTIIYQPIFNQFLPSPFYDNDYIRTHSVNYDAGHGGIFYQQNCGPLKYMEPYNKLHLSRTQALPWENLNDICRRMFNLQIIINQMPIKMDYGNLAINQALQHERYERSKFNMLLSAACNSK